MDSTEEQKGRIQAILIGYGIRDPEHPAMKSITSLSLADATRAIEDLLAIQKLDAQIEEHQFTAWSSDELGFMGIEANRVKYLRAERNTLVKKKEVKDE